MPGFGLSSSPHAQPPRPPRRLLGPRRDHTSAPSQEEGQGCGTGGWLRRGEAADGARRVETHAGCFLESPGGPCCPHSHREMNPVPDSSRPASLPTQGLPLHSPPWSRHPHPEHQCLRFRCPSALTLQLSSPPSPQSNPDSWHSPTLQVLTPSSSYTSVPSTRTSPPNTNASIVQMVPTLQLPTSPSPQPQS